jgi:hypothetical protein
MIDSPGYDDEPRLWRELARRWADKHWDDIMKDGSWGWYPGRGGPYGLCEAREVLSRATSGGYGTKPYPVFVRMRERISRHLADMPVKILDRQEGFAWRKGKTKVRVIACLLLALEAQDELDSVAR